MGELVKGDVVVLPGQEIKPQKKKELHPGARRSEQFPEPQEQFQ